jgi:hypothetical protein
LNRPAKDKLNTLMDPILERPGIRDDAALQQKIRDTAQLYLDMQQHHNASLEAEYRAREKIFATSGAERVTSNIESHDRQLITKRIRTKLVRMNNLALASFMEHPEALDSYRQYLFSETSKNERVFNDANLRREGAVGCREAAKRLIGSIVVRAMEALGSGSTNIVPASFDLHAYESDVRQQKELMDELFGGARGKRPVDNGSGR